jgi:hypothetical protein
MVVCYHSDVRMRKDDRVDPLYVLGGIAIALCLAAIVSIFLGF